MSTEEFMDMLGIVESSGLAYDYKNAWVYLDLFHYNFGDGKTSREEFLKQIAEPIQHYEEYYRAKCPKHADEVMKRAKPGFVSTLDSIVDEYNSLPLEVKAKPGVHKLYYERVDVIINPGK